MRTFLERVVAKQFTCEYYWRRSFLYLKGILNEIKVIIEAEKKKKM